MSDRNAVEVVPCTFSERGPSGPARRAESGQA
jgi:hypothetical protein